MKATGYPVVKRAFDIAVSSMVLIFGAPVWFVIALAIRATSPGPVLFRRTVVGQNGRRFTYFKFRSMVQGDDNHHRQWLREFVQSDAPYQGGDFKVRNDPRVTGVGRVLRQSSLDEVPQLINVLRGEMSIVGPRPPIEYEYEMYDDHAKQRLRVKPGITGLYQVTARSRVPFSGMLALDLEYIERRSLWLDLMIVARTARVLITGGGAG
jgi:lipopolysaccharide/colanic/teichoic acid biosynthesis glycosyltransferase